MGVLDGIKILEMARVAPAELPGMMLADMGAEVLKIETPEPNTLPDTKADGPHSPSSTATSAA
jgi:alpha-methylacyl-CoA racemase